MIEILLVLTFGIPLGIYAGTSRKSSFQILIAGLIFLLFILVFGRFLLADWQSNRGVFSLISLDTDNLVLLPATAVGYVLITAGITGLFRKKQETESEG